MSLTNAAQASASSSLQALISSIYASQTSIPTLSTRISTPTSEGSNFDYSTYYSAYKVSIVKSQYAEYSVTNSIAPYPTNPSEAVSWQLSVNTAVASAITRSLYQATRTLGPGQSTPEASRTPDFVQPSKSSSGPDVGGIVGGIFGSLFGILVIFFAYIRLMPGRASWFWVWWQKTIKKNPQAAAAAAALGKGSAKVMAASEGDFSGFGSGAGAGVNSGADPQLTATGEQKAPVVGYTEDPNATQEKIGQQTWGQDQNTNQLQGTNQQGGYYQQNTDSAPIQQSNQQPYQQPYQQPGQQQYQQPYQPDATAGATSNQQSLSPTPQQPTVQPDASTGNTTELSTENNVSNQQPAGGNTTNTQPASGNNPTSGAH